jgi:predicted acetyltransferase
VREARGDEASAAWALQREAFSLAEGSPSPSEPQGRHQELRVVSHAGRVVSCLTLLHTRLSFRGTEIPMGGIRHVATHPDEQNRGYAGDLVRDTLHRMSARGLPLSVLFPFSFRYYRKFGYELGGNHCHVWCRPNCIPAYAERRLTRPALPEDLDSLLEFCARRATGRTCSLPRHPLHWQALLTDPRVRLTLYGEGDPEGYLVTEDARDSYGGRVLKVLELAASSRRAWRSLLGTLAQAQVESIEWNASSDDLQASGLLRSAAPLREGFKPRAIVTVRPMFQIRVTSVAAALKARAPGFPDGSYRLALRIQDDLIRDNNDPVAIQSGGTGAMVRRARTSDPYLQMDVRTFSQVFCGYLSIADAVSQELAQASSPTALETAELLFPAGDPFLSELDRF